MRLIDQAIDRTSTDSHACALHNQAQEWFARLDNVFEKDELNAEVLEQV